MESMEHEPAEQALRPVLFYALAFAIAWSAWTPLLLHKFEMLRLPIPFPIILFIGQTIGAFAPLLSLLAMQRICNDPTLLQRVFSRLRFRGIAIHWYLIPALTPIVITLVVALGYGLIAGEAIAILRPEPVQELGWALLIVIPFQFALGMIGSPLGEEPGWRGYILDGFARQGRALAGSGIVAGLWWVWHLPLFLVLGVEPTGWTLLAMVGHSLLIDSLFLHCRHNLLTAMLYHQGVNTSFLFFASKAETAAGSAVILVIGLIVRIAVHRMKARVPLS
jgi:membrane protease YdiL (CAAX protease family)